MNYLKTAMDRAALGIEPRTSRALSENHATRPNNQIVQLDSDVVLGDEIYSSTSLSLLQEP